MTPDKKKPIRVYVINLSTPVKKREFLYLQWLDSDGKRHTRSSKCKSHRDATRAAAELEDRLNALAAGVM